MIGFLRLVPVDRLQQITAGLAEHGIFDLPERLHVLSEVSLVSFPPNVSNKERRVAFLFAVNLPRLFIGLSE